MKGTDTVILRIVTHSNLFRVGNSRQGADDILKFWFNTREHIHNNTESAEQCRKFLEGGTLAINGGDVKPEFSCLVVAWKEVIGMCVEEVEPDLRAESVKVMREMTDIAKKQMNEGNEWNEWKEGDSE